MEADQLGSGKKKGEGKVEPFVHHYLRPSRPKCGPSNRENSCLGGKKKNYSTIMYITNFKSLILQNTNVVLSRRVIALFILFRHF